VSVDDMLAHFSGLEWDGLQHEWAMTIVGTGSDADRAIPEGSTLVRLWRDERYHIQGELTGTVADESDLRHDVISSTMVPPLTLHGMDIGGSDYALLSAFSNGTTMRGRDDGARYPFQMRLSHVRVRRVIPVPDSTQPRVRWLTEWYLNGPRSSDIFGRVTNRDITHDYIRSREVSLLKAPEIGYDSTACDYAFIRSETYSFVIHEVPRDFGPSWSRNIGIEYRPEWGGIPTPDERVALAELVGFVLGRRLLNVGYTEYDETGHPIAQYATYPLTTDTVTICSADANPPLNISKYQGGQDIETLLPPLIPVYMQWRGPLRLEDAMWRYVVARELPSGVDLPVVAAAVEGIADAWLTLNDVSTNYLDKTEFKRILRDELSSMKRKLKHIPYHDSIIGKMHLANQMGGGETLRLFFDRVGLKTGPFEKKAMQERNNMAHGSPALPKDIVELERVIRFHITYEVLFERLLLKLLKYDGTYVDRSTPHCPQKHIDEPQTGVVIE